MYRMWGTLLADLVIQMLETDYARILRAIYAFAQVLISYVGNSSSCYFVLFKEFEKDCLFEFSRFESRGHTGYLVNKVTVIFSSITISTVSYLLCR